MKQRYCIVEMVKDSPSLKELVKERSGKTVNVGDKWVIKPGYYPIHTKNERSLIVTASYLGLLDWSENQYESFESKDLEYIVSRLKSNDELINDANNTIAIKDSEIEQLRAELSKLKKKNKED